MRREHNPVVRKKSFFEKLSFRTKKGSKSKNWKHNEGREEDDILSKKHLSDISNHTVQEESTKYVKDMSSNDDIKYDHSSSILYNLDAPSCFIPLTNLWDFPDTEVFRRALKANKEDLDVLIGEKGEDHPDVNARKVQTAEMYKGVGMMQEAVDMLNEVIESHKRSDIEAVLLSSAMNDLALIYCDLHKNANAETLFHNSVEILSQTVEADQAVVWGNIAITLRNSCNYSKAIPMHELAIKMMDTILGKESPEALFQKAQLAVTLKQTSEDGDRVRGESLLAECVTRLKKLGYSSTHVWIKDLL